MAKLNKTRTVAAALLGTLFLSAPIASHAQDFRTTSNSVNSRIVTSGFANRGVTQTRFNTRNNFGIRQTSRGFNNNVLGTSLLKIKTGLFTPRLKVVKIAPKKIATKKVVVAKKSVFSKSRFGY